MNNPKITPKKLLKLLEDGATYAVFQKEKSKTGTVHYQGYVELALRQRESYLHKIMPRAFLFYRKGTADQARDYAMKEDTRMAGSSGPWEHGVFVAKQPGKRNDLNEACAELKEHRSLAKLAESHPGTFTRYHRGFKQFLHVTAKPRDAKPEVCLYFGKTGTGKTRKAMEDNPRLFRKHPDTRWFDGIEERTCLLLDDFSGASSKMSLNYTLQLLDRYNFTVETKGGHQNLMATKIIITTNNHPCKWYTYENREENYAALCRRFDHVYVFELDNNESSFYEVDKTEFFGTPWAAKMSNYWDIALTQSQVEITDEESAVTALRKLNRQGAYGDLSKYAGSTGHSYRHREDESDDDDFEPQ